MLKKALLYIIGSIGVSFYWFAWDTILPGLAKQLQKQYDPLLDAQFWLILTFPLWITIISALFLWVHKLLDKD